MYLYNTTEGGPCVLRPIPSNAFDGPTPGQSVWQKCVSGVDSNGQCEIYDKCTDAWCDKNKVVHGGRLEGVMPELHGPWSEDMSGNEKQQRHNTGWNNQFAFPWEIGMYWNLTVGGVGQRAIGCPGLNEPFGTITKPNWPYRNSNSPIWGSPAMQCEVNDYAPEGRPLYEIIEELASDNEYFAEMFLEGWQEMTSNGYGKEELIDGPQNGWLGYYSLNQQGAHIQNFEHYIATHSPATFTDPKVSRDCRK